jgi:hypothetical protein
MMNAKDARPLALVQAWFNHFYAFSVPALVFQDSAGSDSIGGEYSGGGLVAFPTETVYGLGPTPAIRRRSPALQRPRAGLSRIR